MLNASSNLIRTQPPSFFLSSSSPSLPSQIGRKIAGGIRFHSQAGAATPENVDNMDNTKNNPKTKEERDAMVDSFGVDYATRSIEEGFGVVYGGNQSLDDEDATEIVHGNPAVVVGINKNEEYDDKSHGSEVKKVSVATSFMIPSSIHHRHSDDRPSPRPVYLWRRQY